MTFDFNGETADFYLYYCITQEDEYPENPKFICETTNGEKLKISPNYIADGVSDGSAVKVIE